MLSLAWISPSHLVTAIRELYLPRTHPQTGAPTRMLHVSLASVATCWINWEFNDPGWQREKKATAASPVVKRLREAQPHHPSELRRQYLISIVTLGQSLLWAYFLIFKTVFEIHKIGFIVIVDGSFIHLRIHEANTMSNTKAWENVKKNSKKLWNWRLVTGLMGHISF